MRSEQTISARLYTGDLDLVELQKLAASVDESRNQRLLGQLFGINGTIEPIEMCDLRFVYHNKAFQNLLILYGIAGNDKVIHFIYQNITMLTHIQQMLNIPGKVSKDELLVKLHK